MKKIRFLAIIGMCAGMVGCTVGRNKIVYEFPPKMAEAVQADYRKQCDKGRALYDINCAKCHNSKSGKKTIIPDFTEAQLVSYELRIQNARHEREIRETTVTAEELAQIITFLTYKKRNA